MALLIAQQAPAAASQDEAFAKILVKRVTGANAKQHLNALQAIANANGGTRDTMANVNMTSFDVNADAIADSTARFAFNTAAIP